MPRPAEFSFRTRKNYLAQLAQEELDILVIGGGITGAGIVRDAALRGFKVALVERRDFAIGTSSRSSKLIHGGLRYLQQGDVGLVMEAANERRVLRQLAPHLARPIKMIVPVHSRTGYATIRAGLWTFDRMARVEKDERKEMLDGPETLKLEPLLKPQGIYGSGVYYECLTDDARLVIANIKSAAALGAITVNYANVTSFLSDAGRLTAAVVKDTVSGAAFPVRAKLFINAAGPWVDAVRLLQGEGETPKLHLAKGIHLIVRHDRLPLTHTVVMTTSDKRSIFAIPRGEVVYLGTTDTDYKGPFDDPMVEEEEARYLIETANRYFAVDPLTFADIVGAWAGLRPLLHEEGKKTSEISRKDEIMVGSMGLISIAGGKLTTYRKMAERIVGMAALQLAEQGVTMPLQPKGKSEAATLVGGDTGDDVEQFAADLKERWPRVAAEVVERLVATYGSDAERLIEDIAADPELGERCSPELPVTRAEVEFAVREEMAMTLEDFLERRSRLLLWDPNNGITVAPAAAKLMKTMLGWEERRVELELARYRRHVDDTKAFLNGGIDALPKKVAHAG
ncbi:MAG TPA: glycerol-3-phosphate dehydrogenase [Terriglobales bacterium]|nr:glycerol-3-phosphate dehydrogenase [Terriglobales bacterium]